MPVSTEITGYAASAFAWLYRSTGDGEYLEAARRTARFLIRDAWNAELACFPFECSEGSPAYFFDSGIIVRGLLAVWRLTTDAELLDVAISAGRSMARDFLTESAIHPVVSLPGRQPWPYEKRWSREPGCFQLKAALAWRNLWSVTGEARFREWWAQALGMALANHEAFPEDAPERGQVMDRLHAYSYFMEALLAEPECREARLALSSAIRVTAGCLREIAPRFARSDVYAQLLRVRLLADQLGIVPLDKAAAEEEAAAIRGFQYREDDRRLDGGFCFGRKHGEWMPFANPVSTGFCLQALDWWGMRRRGAEVRLDDLI
jgi:hypothetical protein